MSSRVLSFLPSPPPNKPPRYRSPALRLLGLQRLRARRLYRRVAVRVTLFGGWVWFAAGSLIGFEAFEILFGSFALAPECLPVVILGLALTWYFRSHLRRSWRRIRAYRRIKRMRRRRSSPAPSEGALRGPVQQPLDGRS
ncbi:hypothetical protein GCM10011512_05210 [Tersicoccus solisilvae]|uniref:Uncharacterized protein n=1 Tax=Tersicoccus solisilvae TaxID=1882339 RepID=A0ABQ1NNC9_9MICC|nr:hypothetical protein GCM10011512_05210 [Tersicoccus solisilvae]